MRKRIVKAVICLIAILAMLIPSTVFGMEFSDVQITAPYYKAVDRLSNDGVILGRGDGTFGPRDYTKRKEFCAFIARANNYNESYYDMTEIPFTDVADDWAKEYIAYCYDNGYINGMGNGLFMPDEMVTCEQAVKIVVCATGLGNEELAKVGPMWYSGYINVAKKKGLLEDVEVKISEPADRAFVAQIVYNAMLINEENQNKSDINAVDVSSRTNKTLVKPVEGSEVAAIYGPEEIWEPSPDWNYYQYYGENYIEESKAAEEDIELQPENEDLYEYVPIGSSNGMLIVIDPGHNYNKVDTGAAGNGLREQDITFLIAEQLKPILERNGFSVIMTRNSIKDNVSTESVSASLAKRADIANKNNADLFVSIHCNASNGSGNGTETYYCTGSGAGKKFASFVQSELIDEVGLKNRGVKSAKYSVLKNTNMPAILVETAFIDNVDDAKHLGSTTERYKFAEAIAMGICDFVGIDFN